MKPREQIWALCETLGMPYSPSTEHRGRKTAWDGAVLHGMYTAPDGGWHIYADMDLLHEVGHWLCAEPHNRRYIGFGMGEAPDVGWRTRGSDGPRDASDTTEPTASAVGVLLHLRIDLNAALEHAWDHNWGDYIEEKCPHGRGLRSCLEDSCELKGTIPERYLVDLHRALLQQVRYEPGGLRALAALAEVGINVVTPP